MKKKKGVEPIWVIIHIYMEMSLGNSLYSCLKQAKMSLVFLFLLQNWRIGGQKRSCKGEGGFVPVGGGRWQGKGVGG
jgi:hypothetical protein